VSKERDTQLRLYRQLTEPVYGVGKRRDDSIDWKFLKPDSPITQAPKRIESAAQDADRTAHRTA
jgi:hypothetical protein